MTTVAVEALAQWIVEETNRRHISVRKFAELIGVRHGTLNNILNPKPSKSGKPAYPDFETLVKMAKATNTDLCTLVALIAPNETRIDPEVMIWANRARQLSPEKKEILDAYLIGSRFEP